MLSSAGILRYIKTDGVFLVETRDLVTSTNTVLRQEAAKGAPEGYVLAVDAQSEGRGRLGRKWYSPYGNAVYFSVILRPEIKCEETLLITTAAAVASAHAIESIYGLEVGIKWVNDLFLDGKKVCGILTEASINVNDGSIESAVLGFGINITIPPEGYPKEIKNIATSLAKENTHENTRCLVIARTLDYFWEYYLSLSSLEFLEQYKSSSILIGRDVYVIFPNQQKLAYVITIDDRCRLVVRFDDGEIAALDSGEVRVKGIDI